MGTVTRPEGRAPRKRVSAALEKGKGAGSSADKIANGMGMKAGNSQVGRLAPLWWSMAIICFLLFCRFLMALRAGDARHELVGWSLLPTGIILLIVAWRARKSAGAKSNADSSALQIATEYASLHRFFVSVRVFASDPTADFWVSGGPKLGYFINLGIAAATKEDALRLIKKHIRDGIVDWTQTTWREINCGQSRIPSRNETTEPCVWYSSGRMCFS